MWKEHQLHITLCVPCATCFFLTTFDVICDQFPNRQKATWTLFVNLVTFTFIVINLFELFKLLVLDLLNNDK